MQDEWIIGQSLDGARDYALHMRAPRFVAEIATDEAGSVKAVTIDFFDGRAEGDVARHLADAADAFLEWERRLEEELDDADEDQDEDKGESTESC